MSMMSALLCVYLTRVGAMGVYFRVRNSFEEFFRKKNCVSSKILFCVQILNFFLSMIVVLIDIR